MSTPRRAITKAEFDHLSELAKARGVTVRYQREGGAIVEIVPTIPDPHRDAAVDAAREIDLG